MLCISWIIKCLIIIDARWKHEDLACCLNQIFKLPGFALLKSGGGPQRLNVGLCHDRAVTLCAMLIILKVCLRNLLPCVVTMGC